MMVWPYCFGACVKAVHQSKKCMVEVAASLMRSRKQEKGHSLLPQSLLQGHPSSDLSYSHWIPLKNSTSRPPMHTKNWLPSLRYMTAFKTQTIRGNM